MLEQLPPDAGSVLVRIARTAVADALGTRSSEFPRQDWLFRPGATFVSVYVDGALRGCIGTVEPRRSLLEDVAANAVAAATRDPRFPPVTQEEVPRVAVHVSLLSRLELVSHASEADAMAQVHPGRHGVVLQHGQRRGVLLPQVWERKLDPHEFFAALKMKAGLKPSFWADDIEVRRFTSLEWSG